MVTRKSTTSREAASGAAKSSSNSNGIYPSAHDDVDTLINAKEIVGRIRDPWYRDHWQDFCGPATLHRFQAADMYRAATGLRSILNLLAHDNDEQSAAYSGHAMDDVVLLPSMVRTGLLSGAIALAGNIDRELERARDKAGRDEDKARERSAPK